MLKLPRSKRARRALAEKRLVEMEELAKRQVGLGDWRFERDAMEEAQMDLLVVEHVRRLEARGWD